MFRWLCLFATCGSQLSIMTQCSNSHETLHPYQSVRNSCTYLYSLVSWACPLALLWFIESYSEIWDYETFRLCIFHNWNNLRSSPVSHWEACHLERLLCAGTLAAMAKLSAAMGQVVEWEGWLSDLWRDTKKNQDKRWLGPSLQVSKNSTSHLGSRKHTLGTFICASLC